MVISRWSRQTTYKQNSRRRLKNKKEAPIGSEGGAQERGMDIQARKGDTGFKVEETRNGRPQISMASNSLTKNPRQESRTGRPATPQENPSTNPRPFYPPSPTPTQSNDSSYKHKTTATSQDFKLPFRTGYACDATQSASSPPPGWTTARGAVQAPNSNAAPGRSIRKTTCRARAYHASAGSRQYRRGGGTKERERVRIECRRQRVPAKEPALHMHIFVCV